MRLKLADLSICVIKKTWGLLKSVVEVCIVTLIVAAVMLSTWFATEGILGLFGLSIVGYLAWSMFLVGVVEETIFRYILQDKILEKFLKWKSWMSVPFASVVFGAAHFANAGNWIENLPQVVGATCAGLVLGVAYKKRNLLFVILVHGLYDFLITLVYMYFV